MNTEISARTQDSTSKSTWWKDTWPLHREHWVQIGASLVAVIAVFTAIGFLLTDVFAPNALTDFDVELAERLANNRTESKNDVAHWGAFPADTPVKIGASVLLAGLVLYMWRRWHEAVFVGLTLIFEATAFIITTFIVGRPRPDVPRLLDSPVNTSYPSGHVAAATVYSAIAIVVFWHTRSTWLRAIAVIVTIAIPIAVAWARLYQGMHFLTDVIVGSILGAVSVWICYRILGAPDDAEPLLTNKGQSR